MKSGFVIAALLAALPAVANAGIVRADFREELNLPDYRNGLPRLLEANDRAVGAGPELTAADETTNPDDWDNSLIVDLDGDILTLTPDGPNTYQIITITLDDLVFDMAGQVLESVSLLSNGAVMGADLDFDWTASSLTISYLAFGGLGEGNTFDLIENGVTQFRLTFGDGSTPVPEPAAFGLLGAGLVGIAAMRRRRTA